jgi:RNA polymerase sigma-70 factor (ECF subfamily)
LTPRSDATTFEADLTALIPHLRAFGRSLCGAAAEGDDLAQEALAKAWASQSRFEPGTNLKAWTFMIVRNQFLSDKRRSWRSQPLDPEVAERTLIAADNPSATLEVCDVRRAMMMLSDEQREALILIGAAGLSYEEAAEICQTAVGTIKSRVSRARASLQIILAGGELRDSDVMPSDAAAAIYREADTLRAAALARAA